MLGRTSNQAFKDIIEVYNNKDAFRYDGRTQYELRDIEVELLPQPGRVLVKWGKTLVLATVGAEQMTPKASRPNEGYFDIQCQFKKMVGTSTYENMQTWTKKETQCAGQLDKFLKWSRIVDAESLCILSGEKAWLIRLELIGINNDGSLFDACLLAAVAALKHFSLPDLDKKTDSIDDGDHEEVATVSTKKLSLAVSNLATMVTFCQYNHPTTKETFYILDPTAAEEEAAKGFVRLAINKYGDLLGLLTQDGATIQNPEVEIPKMIELAVKQAQKLEAILG